jgi:hypothetical protein
VLEQQSKAILKVPTKKERGEIDELKDELVKVREEMKSKEARHKLVAERLRAQIAELSERNEELRIELRRNEEVTIEKD